PAAASSPQRARPRSAASIWRPTLPRASPAASSRSASAAASARRCRWWRLCRRLSARRQQQVRQDQLAGVQLVETREAAGRGLLPFREADLAVDVLVGVGDRFGFVEERKARRALAADTRRTDSRAFRRVLLLALSARAAAATLAATSASTTGSAAAHGAALAARRPLGFAFQEIDRADFGHDVVLVGLDLEAVEPAVAVLVERPEEAHRVGR